MKVFESDHVTQDWYSGKKEGKKRQNEWEMMMMILCRGKNNREKRRASQANPRDFNVLFVKTLHLY